MKREVGASYPSADLMAALEIEVLQLVCIPLHLSEHHDMHDATPKDV